ncbi:MAG TPA: hypothetical protein VK013_16250 [Myxococcaceae bacterium]|nr:hypothetical protein [Myxococcaceae bacterium]
MRGETDATLPPDVVRWTFDVNPIIRPCSTLLGREVTFVRRRGTLYGKLTSLPEPVPNRCGSDNPTSSVEVLFGDHPGLPPSTVEISYAEGCDLGFDPTPEPEPIRFTDIQIRAFMGVRETPTFPEITTIDTPDLLCVHPDDTENHRLIFKGRSFISEAPGNGRWIRVQTGTIPPYGTSYSSFYGDQTESTLHFVVPVGHFGNTGAHAWTHRPEDYPYSEAFDSTFIALGTDPACLGRSWGPPVRFEPRRDGCWACDLKLNRYLDPLVLYDRRPVEQAQRLMNGVVARLPNGLLATVSENAEGVPHSVISLHGEAIARFPGIHLRDVSEEGLAVGARVSPKSGIQSAIFFDGEFVKELGTLGGASSVATALSDGEVLVGWSEDQAGARRAFVASAEAGMKTLDLGPHQKSEAIGLGGERWVVGTRVGADGREEGFLYDLEKMEPMLTGIPNDGFRVVLEQVDRRGHSVGRLWTNDQQIVPVSFSPEEGLVRLEKSLEIPDAFIASGGSGRSDEGTLMLSGTIDGGPALLEYRLQSGVKEAGTRAAKGGAQ